MSGRPKRPSGDWIRSGSAGSSFGPTSSAMSRRRFLGTAAAGVAAAGLGAGVASAQVVPQPSGEVWVYPTGTYPADWDHVADALNVAPVGGTVVLKPHAYGNPSANTAFNFGGPAWGQFLTKDVNITGEFVNPSFMPHGPHGLVDSTVPFNYDGGAIQADRTVVAGGLGAFLSADSPLNMSFEKMWLENNYVHPISLTRAGNVLIKNNVIRNTRSAPFNYAFGIYMNTHHPIFEPNTGPLNGNVEIVDNDLDMSAAPNSTYGLYLGDRFFDGGQIDGSWKIKRNKILGSGYCLGINMDDFNPGEPNNPNNLDISNNYVDLYSVDRNCWGIYCYACPGAEYAAQSVSHNTIIVSNTFAPDPEPENPETSDGQTGCDGIMIDARTYADPENHKILELIPSDHFSITKNDITINCETYGIWAGIEMYGASNNMVAQNHISGTTPYAFFVMGESVTTRNNKTFYQNAENNTFISNYLQNLHITYYPGHVGYPALDFVMFTNANYNMISNTPGYSGRDLTYIDFGRGNTWEGFTEKLTGPQVKEAMQIAVDEKKRIKDLLHKGW